MKGWGKTSEWFYIQQTAWKQVFTDRLLDADITYWTHQQCVKNDKPVAIDCQENNVTWLSNKAMNTGKNWTMKEVTSIITIILGPNLQNIVQFIIRLSRVYCCVYLKFTVRLTYDSNLRSCDLASESYLKKPCVLHQTFNKLDIHRKSEVTLALS